MVNFSPKWLKDMAVFGDPVNCLLLSCCNQVEGGVWEVRRMNTILKNVPWPCASEKKLKRHGGVSVLKLDLFEKHRNWNALLISFTDRSYTQLIYCIFESLKDLHEFWLDVCIISGQAAKGSDEYRNRHKPRGGAVNHMWYFCGLGMAGTSAENRPHWMFCWYQWRQTVKFLQLATDTVTLA